MTHIFRNNFSGGELSPEILMRPDLQVYQTGMKTCRNFLVKPQGGIESRPGSEYCYDFGGKKVLRMLPFVFNGEESYVLAFSREDFQVFRNGEPVKDNSGDNVIVDLPFPLTEEEIWTMDFAQSADVMTVTIVGQEPIAILRYGNADWRCVIAEFDTKAIPPVIEDESDVPKNIPATVSHVYDLTDYSLVPKGGGQYEWQETYSYRGTELTLDLRYYVNLGAYVGKIPALYSPNIGQGYLVDLIKTFSTADVPSHLLGMQEFTEDIQIDQRYETVDIEDEHSHPDIVLSGSTTDGNREADAVYKETWNVEASFPTITAVGSGGSDYTKTYRYVITAVYKKGGESKPSDVATITTNSLSTTHGVWLNWAHTEPDKVDYYRVYKSSTGRSGSFGWIGDAENTQFTDFNIAPIVSDSPPERSIAPGKPACVTYYQQRQVFGDLETAPLTFVASKVASPFLFRQSRPIQPDDAFSVTAATPRFNHIQYLVPLGSLLVLTTGSELRSSEGDSEAFTASTTGIRRLSTEGCAKVKPEMAGSTLIYVQANEKRLRSIQLDPRGGYLGTDLTLLARHLFDDARVRQIAFSMEPSGVLWCVTKEGYIRTLTYQKAQSVTAWQQHVLAGGENDTARPLSVVTVPEDHEDVPYLLVERGAGPNVRRTLERIKHLPGIYGVDFWTKSRLNTPGTFFTGFDHLKEETVAAVADGFDLGGVEVNSQGEIETPFPATEVYAGYVYRCTADLPPIASSDMERSNPKGINEVVAHVKDTRGICAGALDENTGEPVELWEAYPASVDTAYNTPKPYTGRLQIGVGGPWSTDAALRIQHEEPFRAEVLAVEAHIDV